MDLHFGTCGTSQRSDGVMLFRACFHKRSLVKGYILIFWSVCYAELLLFPFFRVLCLRVAQRMVRSCKYNYIKNKNLYWNIYEGSGRLQKFVLSVQIWFYHLGLKNLNWKFSIPYPGFLLLWRILICWRQTKLYRLQTTSLTKPRRPRLRSFFSPYKK